MEALLAVGLAGNVAQFVQFAGKLISEARSIKKNGSPKSIPELKHLSETLTTQAGVIKTRLKARYATLTEEDQNLLDVATDCETCGVRFVSYLDTFIDKPSSFSFRGFQSGVKFQWEQHKIEEFVVKLDKLRSVLTLATMLALRTSAYSNNEEILAHLKEIEADSQARGVQDLRTQTTIQLLVDIVQDQAGNRLNTIQTEIRECVTEIQKLRTELPQTQENTILKWLNFRQMLWRYEEIPLAYQRTFQWIFEVPPDAEGWGDFSAYLTGKDINTPYFINGKAGSGKSTLIKFILNSEETEKKLQQWAGSDDLLVLSFFFWNLGTRLQKTHVGMLRGLIHGILERYPELIPVVFAELYRNWKELDANIEPTYAEVKKAFELLLRKSASFLKLCIFVDGIDELEGDYKDMAGFLHSLVSPQVKIIVSSRPINPCLVVFEDCPSLRLQDLTKNDMEIFVKDNLVGHRSMAELMNLCPGRAGELISEIGMKAEGVFLWVKIVVKLLVDGLEDGDDMKDLQRKLLLLPPDLKDLYRRMIGKVPPDYQSQAAQIFRIFHTWNRFTENEPLSVITLSFATRDPSEVFHQKVANLEPEALRWLGSTTEARIRSRCCGLLEIHKKVTNYQAQNLVVGYLHRTVAEFLTSDDVWLEICAMTEGSFDPFQHLTSACLSMMKVAHDFEDPILRLNLIYTTAFCRTAESFPDQTMQHYITTIDETMKQHQYNLRTGGGVDSMNSELHWSSEFYIPKDGVSNERDRFFLIASNIFTFAARNGLVQYLKTCCKVIRDLDNRSAMVLHALDSWRGVNTTMKQEKVPLAERLETLHLLLRNFARAGDDTFGFDLEQHGAEVGYDLLKSERFMECKELLKLCFSSIQPPMVRKALPARTHHFSDIIDILMQNESSDVSKMGAELHQMHSRGTQGTQYHQPYSLDTSVPRTSYGPPKVFLESFKYNEQCSDKLFTKRGEPEYPGPPIASPSTVEDDLLSARRMLAKQTPQYLSLPMIPNSSSNGAYITIPSPYQQSLPMFNPDYPPRNFTTHISIFPGLTPPPYTGYKWSTPIEQPFKRNIYQEQ